MAEEEKPEEVKNSFLVCSVQRGCSKKFCMAADVMLPRYRLVVLPGRGPGSGRQGYSSTSATVPRVYRNKNGNRQTKTSTCYYYCQYRTVKLLIVVFPPNISTIDENTPPNNIKRDL